MQDGDISPTEFYKVLQEVEKYRKLKADIRNQAKAKVKEITTEQREEILEAGRKEGKEDFFEKSQTLQVPRVAVPFEILISSTLRHVILWSIKTIKIGLKFIFPVCGINFRIQHLTCPLIDHRITIHHDNFLKSLPCKFSHRVFHQLLIRHMLINRLLLSKFI